MWFISIGIFTTIQRNLYTWIIYVRWIFQVIYFLLLFCACCSGICFVPSKPRQFCGFPFHSVFVKSVFNTTQKKYITISSLFSVSWYLIYDCIMFLNIFHVARQIFCYLGKLCQQRVFFFFISFLLNIMIV